MSTATNFCIFLIFLSFTFEGKNVMASEGYSVFGYQKSSSQTGLEQNLLESQEVLVEEMRKEFEKQKTQFAQDRLNMKSELMEKIGLTENFVKDELNNQNEVMKTFETNIKSFVNDKFVEQQQQQADIQREISEQKLFLKEFIKDELTSHQDKLQKDIKNEFVAICIESLTTKMQIIAENITKELQNVQKFEENQISRVLEVIHDSTISSSRWSENFTCIKNCEPVSDLPNNCEEAMKGTDDKNGIYLLNGTVYGLSSFFVYCKKIEGKFWTVIQRREDGSIDFYRNWTDYKYGFGNLYGEFWMGLERMHAMTTKHKHELYVWMEAKNTKTAFARYDQFAIGNETEKYKLTFGNYSGIAGNSLNSDYNYGDHYGMKFSTYDDCNDNHTEEGICCTKTYKGGWWFNDCYNSHLNGPYFSERSRGVDWDSFGRKLKYVEMAIHTTSRLS